MADSLEVRVAREQDNEFFYLGYSYFPGKDAVKRSLANPRGYAPHKLHPNDDNSITIEWQQTSFGFTPKERQQGFYQYIGDAVVPQLEDAIEREVVFEGDLRLVRLQLTDVARGNGPEGYVVTRRQLGSMSLFVAQSELNVAAKEASSSEQQGSASTL